MQKNPPEMQKNRQFFKRNRHFSGTIIHLHFLLKVFFESFRHRDCGCWFGIFYWKRRKNEELPLKNDNFTPIAAAASECSIEKAKRMEKSPWKTMIYPEVAPNWRAVDRCYVDRPAWKPTKISRRTVETQSKNQPGNSPGKQSKINRKLEWMPHQSLGMR